MITIGKYKLGHDECIHQTYPNTKNLLILSEKTRNNVNKLKNKINFQLSYVYVGYRKDTNRKSFYIEGYINNNKILIARKETNSPMAGQTKLYSEYAVKQFNKIINKPISEILIELKIL
jgi:hypothetical protein